MASLWIRRITCLVVILATLAYAPVVQAARGIPGSPEFGIGTSLDITRSDLPVALEHLKELKPDWLRVEVRWETFEPTLGYQTNWGILDQSIQAAASAGIPVLISLTAAPSWALTATGPEKNAATRFSLTLVNRYPGTVQALELFPSANTTRGWQAKPNPTDYIHLVQSVQSALIQAGSPILLVAGGLNPCSTDADALEYLRGLYASGAPSVPQIISLQFSNVTGEPFDPPASCQNLRYYELIREVMLANHQSEGKVWITHLNLPSGLSPEKQENWLTLAYTQIRSQLYFGSGFLQTLNITNSGSLPLLQPESRIHPFFSTLVSLIQHNLYLGESLFSGRVKATIFSKVQQ